MSGWGEAATLTGALAAPQHDIFYHVRGGGFGYLRPRSDSYGPELSFGRTIGDAEPDISALLKSAEGSTSLAVDWNPDGGACYSELIARVNNAKRYWTNEGYEVRVAGIAWMQGEQDAKFAGMSAAYETNFIDFITRLRDDLQAPDVPFIYGLIRGADFPHRETVRGAQRAIPALVHNAFLIDTDDLTTFEGLHFDSASQITLGQRFATAMLGLRSPVAGDANGDGVVDLEDLNSVRNNFGGHGEGDVTHDGRIGLDDLNVVRNEFGGGTTNSISEPTSIVLVLFVAAATMVQRRPAPPDRLNH